MNVASRFVVKMINRFGMAKVFAFAGVVDTVIIAAVIYAIIVMVG